MFEYFIAFINWVFFPLIVIGVLDVITIYWIIEMRSYETLPTSPFDMITLYEFSGWVLKIGWCVFLIVLNILVFQMTYHDLLILLME
jgi:hypothetical protein